MIQPSLLDWTPPPIKGETFDAARDGKRLSAQAADVYALMRDGRWRTLGDISEATGHPEASVSARLRDLRGAGHTVERAYVSRGLWRYRVTG